jgi:hypothetical protein
MLKLPAMIMKDLSTYLSLSFQLYFNKIYAFNVSVFFFIYKFCGYDRHNVAKISNKLQYMINGETTILVFKYTSSYYFDLQFAEKHKIMLNHQSVSQISPYH